MLKKEAPPGQPGWRLSPFRYSGFFARSRLAEVVVVGHAPADVGVEVPLHHALGELLLRLLDLAEQRVVGALLRRRVVGFELAREDRVGRLVEAHLVL